MIGLRAGRLRHCVDIQSKTETRDALGGFIEAWTTTDTRFASVEPIKAKEVLRGDQIDSRITHKIIMRYYDGLEASQRFRFGQRIFNIFSILNIDERNHQMEVLVTEDKKLDISDDLLLESGDFILTEDGEKIILES